MTLTYAEFCAGYGGLGLAVEEVFGAELKWYSEFDAAPSKIMAHHWPGVPNHGDMTAIDWNAVEKVDVLSGGTPCQDLSTAGARKGMTEGTRSNLWVHMREAIAVIKPKYVVWENVRGAYSASASSDLEQCPGCVGDTSDGRVFLRALGRVLGDLSDLGYDCQWRGLRASDLGACHGRYRVFILATHRDHIGDDRPWAWPEEDGRRELANSHQPNAYAYDAGCGEQRWSITVQPEYATAEYAGTNAAYTESSERDGSQQQNLPAPARSAAELGELAAQTTPDPNSRHDDGRLSNTERGTQRREATSRSGAGFGTHAKAERLTKLLPTPTSERPDARKSEAFSKGRATFFGVIQNVQWGEYEPAIRRWERALGRTAPRPTEPTGRDGGHRLSPRLTEWMMGLDDGWVTAPEIGLTRNEQLKACGNGVVPQQAIAALQDMANYKKGDP